MKFRMSSPPVNGSPSLLMRTSGESIGDGIEAMVLTLAQLQGRAVCREDHWFVGLERVSGGAIPETPSV